MREQQLSGGSIDHGQGAIGFLPIDLTVSSVTRRNDRKRLGALGTAALAFITACGGNVGAAPTKIGGDSRPENTGMQQDTPIEGQVLGAQGEKSIDEIFDNFLAENVGVHEERPVILRWFDALEIPEEALVTYKNTNDLINNPTDATKQFFEIISKTEGAKPQKGDIIIVKSTDVNNRGYVAIAIGDEVSENGIHFENVLTKESALERFNFEEIAGWMHPKGYTSSDTGNQGEVLGARTGPIDEILKDFIFEYNGEPVEKNDRENLNQCMDLVTAWVDALGIPRSTVIGLEVAKNLYQNPHPITGDYFDTITYEPDMEIKPGDIAVWNEGVGSSAGHAAIATGEENLYFSQNYPAQENPANNTAHLQEISDRGLIGILRPKGFGPSEQPDRTKAPEKVDPKARIDAILAVEPGDSDMQMATKMILSKFFNALNSSQTDNYNNTDRVLDVSVTNLESWESNITRLLNGESINDDPLKISFVSTHEDWQRVERRSGRGEMDNIRVNFQDYSSTISDIDRKNGWEAAFGADISFFERSHAISYEGRIRDDRERKKFLDDRTMPDELPPITEWAESSIHIGASLKNGVWNLWISSFTDDDDWEGIDLVPRMFRYPSCNYQANFDSGWATYNGCLLISVGDN